MADLPFGAGLLNFISSICQQLLCQSCWALIMDRIQRLGCICASWAQIFTPWWTVGRPVRVDGLKLELSLNPTDRQMRIAAFELSQAQKQWGVSVASVGFCLFFN